MRLFTPIHDYSLFSGAVYVIVFVVYLIVAQ